MSQLSNYISSVLPRRVEGSYDALSNGGPDAGSCSQSRNEEEVHSDATSREYQRLLMQCFVYISLSIVFIIAFTTTTTITATAKCRSSSTVTPVAVPHPIMGITNLVSTKVPTDCGTNAKTARERGCHFDIISFTWLRHECFDHELMEQFSREKEWQWSLDANGTTLVSEEQIRNGEVEVGWVTWEYHLTHCLYTWKKLNRAVERRGAIDGYISNYNHTSHCSRLLLAKGVEMETWNSEFFVQYPRCYLQVVGKDCVKSGLV